MNFSPFTSPPDYSSMQRAAADLGREAARHRGQVAMDAVRGRQRQKPQKVIERVWIPSECKHIGEQELGRRIREKLNAIGYSPGAVWIPLSHREDDENRKLWFELAVYVYAENRTAKPKRIRRGPMVPSLNRRRKWVRG